MKAKLFIMIFCFGSLFVGADSYLRNPQIDILTYRFKIYLNDQNDSIAGEATIQVKCLSAGVKDFALDLQGKENPEDAIGMTVSRVERDGQLLDFTFTNHRLTIRLKKPVEAGEAIAVKVFYRGVPAEGLIISENRHGDRTFFGDNWPDAASFWLPTIDHPYDKAACEFVVVAPAHYQVVANGVLQEERDLGGNQRLTHWREEAPLPTKLMVIGVARFAVKHEDNWGNVAIQTWVFPQDRNHGYANFSPVKKVLVFFSERIGPYSYGKIASVQSKTRFGGMENAGAVFYYEKSAREKQDLEGLIAHEMAHQWFGDAVTEGDWHHVWLSEGFATYYTTIYFEFTHGSHHLKTRMERARKSVIVNCDKKPRSTLVDFKIEQVRQVLNTNSYQKGAWVLHMLRKLIGSEKFFAGISAFYRQYQNKTALTEDFQNVMEEVTGKDLSSFFKQWVYEPGYPKLKGYWKYKENKGQLRVVIHQAQKSGVVFQTPLDIGILIPDRNIPVVKTVTIDKKKNTFVFDMPQAPREVRLDPDVWLLMKAEFNRK